MEERMQQMVQEVEQQVKSGAFSAKTGERFRKNMSGFLKLFSAYERSIKEGTADIDWDKMSTERIEELVVPYEECRDTRAEAAGKLAVLKLNGGLGTTMGCTGPKSVIEVREGLTFLDLIVQQIQRLNEQHEANVPLVLMNSFNTQKDTAIVVQKYEDMLDVISFEQSQHPRFLRSSHLPAVQQVTPESFANTDLWYPPGHGDIFEALVDSGTLQQLEERGVEYLFISNVDNLGATVDMRILNMMIEKGSEFVMEVTAKTAADVKGGTLIEYDDGKNGPVTRLLELAQVPKAHVHEFTSIEKFKVFNTNSVWVSVSAIRRVVEDGSLRDMELIENHKTLRDGTPVIQLERAMGSAIRFFNKSLGVEVPRSRFLPVKKTDDLFLIQSNVYEMRDGSLVMSERRKLPGPPLVKLDAAHFGKVKDFNRRFDSIPDIIDLSHLTVSGDVTFGINVRLAGTVIVVAHPGCHINIPARATIQNKIVSGDLRILEH